jgi:hypothetical protein
MTALGQPIGLDSAGLFMAYDLREAASRDDVSPTDPGRIRVRVTRK